MPDFRRLMSGPTFRISLATGMAAGSSYVVAKAAALTHGPVGVGVLGASLGTISLMLAIGHLGFSSALPATVRRDKRRSLALGVLLWASLTAAVIVLLASCGLLVFASAFEAFDGVTSGDVAWLGIAAFSALEVFIVAVLGSVFVGSTYSAFITFLTSAVSASISAAILLVSPNCSIPMALGMGAIGSLLVVVPAGIGTFFRLDRGIGDPADRFSWQRLVRLCLSMWAAALGSSVALAVYPVIAFAGLGDFDSGLLKAAMSISISVFYVGSAWITGRFYPALASVTGNSDLTSEVLVVARLRTMQVLTPAAVFISLAAPALLWLLFTEDFVQAWPSVIVLTIGSLIRVVIALNVAVMSAKRGIRGPAVTEWTFATIVLVGSIIAIEIDGSIGAYLAAFTLAILAALIASERELRRDSLPSFLNARSSDAGS